MVGIFSYTIPFPWLKDKVGKRAVLVEQAEPADLPLPPEQPGIWSEVVMPVGAKVLSVVTALTAIAIWAAVPATSEGWVTRRFLLLTSGESFDETKMPALLVYRGTVCLYEGHFTWHVFEPLEQVLAEVQCVETLSTWRNK